MQMRDKVAKVQHRIPEGKIVEVQQPKPVARTHQHLLIIEVAMQHSRVLRLGHARMQLPQPPGEGIAQVRVQSRRVGGVQL